MVYVCDVEPRKKDVATKQTISSQVRPSNTSGQDPSLRGSTSIWQPTGVAYQLTRNDPCSMPVITEACNDADLSASEVSA